MNFSRVSLLFIITLTASCGFALKSEPTLTERNSPVYLESSTDRDLLRALDDRLTELGIEMTVQVSTANSTIGIDSVEKNRRVVSVDVTGGVREYELIMIIGFSIDRSGEKISDSLELYRTLTYQSRALLANNIESQNAYREMYEEAADALIRILGARD